MHYVEEPPSAASEGLIKAFWSLDVGMGRNDLHENDATPDGTIEIIRRTRGASSWGHAQPSVFAAGLTTRPARVTMRGDAAFIAARLWPWTWRMLGEPPCANFIDRWIPLPPGSKPSGIADRLQQKDAVESLVLAAVAEFPNGQAVHEVGQAILRSSSVAEIGRLTGLRPRSLQRWAEAYIGLPLRTYLRLIRFQSALANVGGGARTLAQAAAIHGYADQAHMARTFRELAGGPPVATKGKTVRVRKGA
jgi:AraC-like DNA-binding protein